MRKRYFLGAAIAGFFVSTPAFALPCDNRGSNWNGTAQVGATHYNFEFRRQSCAPASMWNFYLRSRSTGAVVSQGQVMVNLDLSSRAISVTPVPGTATGCPFSLTGTYAARDVTNGRPYRGSGTASCGGTGVWKATIR